MTTAEYPNSDAAFDYREVSHWLACICLFILLCVLAPLREIFRIPSSSCLHFPSPSPLAPHPSPKSGQKLPWKSAARCAIFARSSMWTGALLEQPLIATLPAVKGATGERGVILGPSRFPPAWAKKHTAQHLLLAVELKSPRRRQSPHRVGWPDEHPSRG